VISVWAGRLAAASTEAVLRPTRSDWTPMSPAVRDLDVAAGTGWLETCAAQGDLPVGSAVVTGSGDLPCDVVIHLAVGSRQEPAATRSLTSALRNALRRASEWDLASLTVPILGTGPGGLEPREACALMAPLLAGWAGKGEREVRVASRGDAEIEAARATWKES